MPTDKTKTMPTMSRDTIQANADKLHTLHILMLEISNTITQIAQDNQQSVDHYTQWEPKYDEFQDKESAIRSAEIAMRLEQAADDIQAAANQMSQAMKIAVEGEMR